MAVRWFWTYLLCLWMIAVVDVAGKCSITSTWIDLSMEERLVLADIVVYGRTKEHRASSRIINGRNAYSINAVFEVYCVLKKDEDDVPETLIVEGIAPRDGCSGTKTHMQIDNEAVVALKRTYGGKFEYHEVMPMLSATFAATKSHLLAVSSTCTLQGWQPPQGAASSQCPICGTANFSSALMMEDQDLDLTPCIQNGVLNANLSDCQLSKQTPTANTVCINRDYDVTCTRLALANPNVACECTNLQLGSGLDGPISETDSATTSLPCQLTLFLGLLFLWLATK